MTIVIHNLAANTHGLKSCKLAQIHRGFGVPSAHQNATLASTQGEHMTGTTKIPGLSALVSTFLHGIGTLVGRDTCGGIHMVDGYGKSSFVVIRILANHGAKLQLIHNFTGGGHAN